MDQTPKLGLAYVAAAQAQKHVTINQSLRRLDALTQIAVLDRDLAASPSSPAEGDCYIVAAGASGAWSGKAGQLAAFQDGAWAFFPPQAGWSAWIADEAQNMTWDGAAWAVITPDEVDKLGVNTSADATNRLAVSSDAVLFTHDGAGVQAKLNKADAAATASVLWQTGFSGRAELGLAGDDDLHMKVSATGASWTEALIAKKDSGRLQIAQGVIAPLSFAGASGAPVWRHDPAEIDADSARFNFVCKTFAGVNAPASSRADTVWRFGYNITDGGGRENTSEPTLAIEFENCYHNGGTDPNPALEWHLASMDKGGTVHRPISFYLPREAGHDSIAIGSIAAGAINFNDYSGVQRIKWDFTAATTAVYFTVGTQLSFDINNSVALRQKNAAGSAYINLPYVDSSNRVTVDSPFYVHAAAAESVFNAVLPLYVNTPADNKSMIRFALGAALTGTMFLFDGTLDCSNAVRTRTFNNNASGGHAIAEMLVHVSGGDPKTLYSVNGSTTWSVGLDNSDSDKFKIASNSALETNTKVTIDATSGLMDVAGPVKVKGFTVSGLPSAATSGAGAIAYVSNESGGAVLAFSDGTDWRRVTDRAVVS